MHQYIKTLYLQLKEKEYSVSERQELLLFLQEEIPKCLRQYQETQDDLDLKDLLRLEVFYQILLQQDQEVYDEDGSQWANCMGVSRAV